MPGSEGDEYNSVVSLLEREEPGWTAARSQPSISKGFQKTTTLIKT